MLAELGPLPLQEGSVRSGFAGIKALFVLDMRPLLFSSLLLLVLMPRWRVALAWLLCLAALFAIGVMGRPGVLRIYVPLMSLLMVAPLVIGKYRQGARPWMVTLTLLAACVGNAYLYIPDALASKQWSQQVRNDIQGLPAGPIVSWGEDFSYELAFPVLANDLNSRNIRFYGLDSFTLAPFSAANSEQMASRGILERLRSAAGIPIIASPERIEMLSIYCREHLNGQLRWIIAFQASSLTLQQVRCDADE